MACVPSLSQVALYAVVVNGGDEEVRGTYVRDQGARVLRV